MTPARRKDDPNASDSSVLRAIAQAERFLRRAERLKERFARITKQYGIVYAAGKVRRDGGSPEGRNTESPDAGTDAPVETLESMLGELKNSVGTLRDNVSSASGQVPETDPAAADLREVFIDANDLYNEIEAWRAGEVADLTERKEEVSAMPPSDQLASRLENIQRMLEAYEGKPDAVPGTPNLDEVRSAINERAEPKPEPAPAPTPDPALPAAPEPPVEPRPEPSTVPPPVPPTPETLRPVTGEVLPWPASKEAIRAQFTYSPEKFGTPKEFVDHLAVQLNTDEKLNEYLEAMFEYSLSRDTGKSQTTINNGSTEKDEHWEQPLTFFTTYNANGKNFGDCDDVAIAFTHLKKLQGKPAFTLSTYTSEKKEDGGVLAKGHMISAWFETNAEGNRVAKMIDTTGLTGRSHARLRQVVAEPGESDDALIQRLYLRRQAEPVNPRAISSVHLLPNGNAFDIPANLSLIKRHEEIEGHLKNVRYDAVLAIVKYELAADPTNLNLHMANIQFLLLTNASRDTVSAAVAALKGPPEAEKPITHNAYEPLTVIRLLAKATPPYRAEIDALKAHIA
jgi:hypothetical protein